MSEIVKAVFREQIFLEQRSEDWTKFRQKRIGASEAGIICGLNPWTSSIQLWGQKLNRLPRGETSFAAQRGIRLEPVVLGLVNLEMDRDFKPAVFKRLDREYMISSLDGWEEDTNEALEIKCGNVKDHNAMRDDKETSKDRIVIPEKYYPQLQHQMIVMDLAYAWYASYHLPKGLPDMGGSLKIVKVHRDEDFIKKYIPLLERFYESIITEKPPEAVELRV